MPFGLKNVGDTYQRAMNLIFHKFDQDLIDLEMNPEKCAFGIMTDHFLSFLVHRKWIEVDRNKAKAILEVAPPKNKLELQILIRKINFLRQFIVNSTSKFKAFSPLLLLKKQENFVWGKKQQEVFDHIEQALASPPVLVPPTGEGQLKLYVSTTKKSIDFLLAQKADDGTE